MYRGLVTCVGFLHEMCHNAELTVRKMFELTEERWALTPCSKMFHNYWLRLTNCCSWRRHGTPRHGCVSVCVAGPDCRRHARLALHRRHLCLCSKTKAWVEVTCFMQVIVTETLSIPFSKFCIDPYTDCTSSAMQRNQAAVCCLKHTKQHNSPSPLELPDGPTHAAITTHSRHR